MSVRFNSGFVLKRKTVRMRKADSLDAFIASLAAREAPLAEFTQGLWVDTIDRVIVQLNGSLVFRFLDGSEITV